jgi:hypothetical protein
MAVNPGAARAVVLATVVALVGLTDSGGSDRGDRADGAPVDLEWRTYGVEDGLPGASVRSIHVSGDDLWVGTDSGLALGRDGRWTGWTTDDGLPRAPISAIDVDPRTGDVWLGTLGEGLVRFTAGRFDRFTQFNSGLAGDQVFDVAVEDGGILAATNGGLSSFEPATDVWDLFVEPRADLPEIAVTSLCSGSGALHAGTWCGPLLRFDEEQGRWNPVTPTGQARLRPDTSVAAAAVERALWWVTQAGLFRRTGSGRWKALQLPAVAGAGAFVNCLGARSESEAWLGTDSGLLVLADWATETWIVYRRIEGASSGEVSLVRSGRIVETRAVPSTLPDNRIRCLAFQDDGVWVGTHRGLVRGSRPGSAELRDRPPRDSVASEVDEGRRIPIGVLAPLSRPIARPMADSAYPADAVDHVAVERAVSRARRRASEIKLVENLYTFARYGWGTLQDSFSILRGLRDVRGLIGYIGPHARIDTATALRTEVPLVNVAPTEPTPDESVHPWIFRCGSNDPRRHRLLLDHVLDSQGGSRLAAVRPPDPEDRIHLDRWVRHARRRGHEPVAELDGDPEAYQLATLIEELRRSQADVVLTWSDARTSAVLLRRLREAGLNALFVGGDRIVNREFITLAGPDPGPVIALGRCPHHDSAEEVAPPETDDLRRRLGLSRLPPSPHATRSFEATEHLIAAIERGGPERQAIREALREMEYVTLARLEDGAWHFRVLSQPAAGQPATWRRLR